MRNWVRVATVATASITFMVAMASSPALAKKPKPAATPQILVTCSPNPAVETGVSQVQVVCQVEANPSLAGKFVTLSSTQFGARCAAGSAEFINFNGASVTPSATLQLDNDGNATEVLVGTDCAPGSALIDASLDAPPFATAITKLVMEPPQVTAPGVKAFPNPEVEVGDNPAAVAPNNIESEADVVFYVETNPVYAEQLASLTSDQLEFRCGLGFVLENRAGIIAGSPFDTVSNIGGVVPSNGLVAEGPIDNDGNTVFIFFGGSCAAGKSTVIAEIGGGGPTYSTQFNILPPAVTI